MYFRRTSDDFPHPYFLEFPDIKENNLDILYQDTWDS